MPGATASTDLRLLLSLLLLLLLLLWPLLLLLPPVSQAAARVSCGRLGGRRAHQVHRMHCGVVVMATQHVSQSTVVGQQLARVDQTLFPQCLQLHEHNSQ